MENDDLTHEAEAQLKRLEQRVGELILMCDRLREENRTLRAQQQMLSAQRASLMDKHEMARSRVEAMVTRLKSMERGD
jgi:cell division protein ZapB